MPNENILTTEEVVRRMLIVAAELLQLAERAPSKTCETALRAAAIQIGIIADVLPEADEKPEKMPIKNFAKLKGLNS